MNLLPFKDSKSGCVNGLDIPALEKIKLYERERI